MKAESETGQKISTVKVNSTVVQIPPNTKIDSLTKLRLYLALSRNNSSNIKTR